MSISGGIHTAFRRAESIGCTTMQIFTKNAGQWRGKPLSSESIQSYKNAAAQVTISPVVAHAAYLINLCAPKAATLKDSRSAFLDELQRCEALGIDALIFHPGSHLGRGEDEGIIRIAESLNIAHEQTAHFRVLTTLETTAGQGTALGYRFEHLQRIIDLIEQKNRIAICIDTCHLFAAGYDISTEEAWDTTIRLFDDIVGLSRLAAIHVNDSKKEFNSRVDRHEHIGKGKIGLTAFRMLMNDARLAQVPKILETEKSEDMHEDVQNIAVLRSLIHAAPQKEPSPGMDR